MCGHALNALSCHHFLRQVDLSKLGPSAEDDASKKKKGAKKGKSDSKKDTFTKLMDEEKNDLVGQEVEIVQAEIETVSNISVAEQRCSTRLATHSWWP